MLNSFISLGGYVGVTGPLWYWFQVELKQISGSTGYLFLFLLSGYSK